MATNPQLQSDYQALREANGPRFGVSISPSVEFETGSGGTIAWFVNVKDAKSFAYENEHAVWDLVNGVLV